MRLSREDCQLFFKLYEPLLQFVHDALKVAPTPEPTSKCDGLTPQQRKEAMEALIGRLDLLDTFAALNPAQLTPQELQIVSNWRYAVAGRFIVLRQLKRHAVLLSTGDTAEAYAVLGLSQPISDLVAGPVPRLVETVLLPFLGKIVCHGILGDFNVVFGSGTRRRFDESFRAARENGRFFVMVPRGCRVAAAPANVTSDSLRRKEPETPRASAREILPELIRMTDEFCLCYLTEEYAVLCRTAAEKLARKRPSPLLSGELHTWACAVIRAIGSVNFLSDRSQRPHLNPREIDRHFGVAQSTGQNKAKAVRTMLSIRQFDFKWTLPSRWEEMNPIWTLQTREGYIIDVRSQPAEVQRQAFRQGLIPYVPTDRVAAVQQEKLASGKTGLLYQFKIVLRSTEPPVWRRIQVFDETLDRLHEHIQAAMGWTNSHLHHFLINGRRCGDPDLLNDGSGASKLLDSTKTLISAVAPADGKPFSFEYEYDFGDSWLHDVIFEGNPPEEAGIEYPRCLEGERACPPEDVGGPCGYVQYLQAIADPNHEQHQELMDWGGKFDPNKFNLRQATHMMQEGLPDWRKML